MPTLQGWPTDGDDGSVANEARWRAMARLWAPSGVVAGYLGDLVPSLAAGTITVQAGAAWVDGHYCEATGSNTFTATVTGLVVIRFTPADNTFEMLYRDGATTPTQTTATWELPIARITASVLYDVRTVIPVGGSTSSQLGHVVLAAAAPSISFPNLPQTFNHLRLVASLRADSGSTAVVCFAQFNGNASGYDHQTIRGTGTTTSATHTANDNGIRFAVPGATGYAPNFTPVTIDIPNYRATTPTQRRTYLMSYGWTSSDVIASSSGDIKTETMFGLWRTANAVSSLVVAPQSGNLAAGSVATLYGLM